MRFFWRLGDIPERTEFPALNAAPVIPDGYPRWKETMDNFGDYMLEAALVVAQLLAIGLQLPSDAFTKLMHQAPHLLAPTGSDMGASPVGTVLAGFHQDLNFLSVHSKSRYPGLYIWNRDGTRMAAKVPEGCLLVQAGLQAEYLTGGAILAGYHEVVVTEAAKERAKSGGTGWRVSSTVFSHIASDATLTPLIPTAETDKYPEVLAGDQVLGELRKLRLAAGS